MNTFKISAIITAGGTSSRFGSNKLLEEINGKKIIEITIEKFLPLVDEIIIPTSLEIQEKITIKNNKIKYATGGKTRQESVYNGLLKCEYKDFVLIHDGARPFIEENVIKNAIEKVLEFGAVVVGASAIDTIKICNDKGEIVSTPKRETVFHAQTPQGFRYSEILKAHEKLKGENFTDDSSMMEELGHKVYIVKATHENKKITFREDLN